MTYSHLVGWFVRTACTSCKDNNYLFTLHTNVQAQKSKVSKLALKTGKKYHLQMRTMLYNSEFFFIFILLYFLFNPATILYTSTIFIVSPFH